jgi:MFS transporter, YNFM family, putative membrane transport protein
MSMMSHVATLPRMGSDARSAGVIARFFVIALTAFLTVVDLFATQAILPSLTRTYGVSPAAMGSAVNASTLGMAIAGLGVAIFSRKIDRRLGILISLARFRPRCWRARPVSPFSRCCASCRACAWPRRSR